MKKFLIAYQYMLLVLLMASSGFPFFYSNQEYILIGFILSIIYILFTKGILKIDTYFVIITFLLFGWELFQGFYNDNVVFRQVIGTALRLGFSYLVLKSLGISFICL